MTAPTSVLSGEPVVMPLSPAKIAINDPASIVTALVAIVATVLNAWPGALHGLPANAPSTTALIAAALAVSTIFSKHLLSAAAVTAAATPTPVTHADLAAHADAQRQALAKLQEALAETVSALSAPPGAVVGPSGGSPVVAGLAEAPAGP